MSAECDECGYDLPYPTEDEVPECPHCSLVGRAAAAEAELARIKSGAAGCPYCGAECGECMMQLVRVERMTKALRIIAAGEINGERFTAAGLSAVAAKPLYELGLKENDLDS